MRVISDFKGKDYKAMTKLSLIAFLSELPNFILTVISATISHTPVVWVDTINSLGETLHCFLVFIVTNNLQKNNEEKYNFGVERIETFSSFCCDALVIIGMLSVSVGAIYGLINPTLPADNLILFFLLKISNSLWDLAFLISCIKAAKKADSKLGDSEVRNYVKALVFDVLIGIVVGITYFFRDENWVCYANPIVSIILVIVFVCIYIKKIKETIGEITDKSISVPSQDRVFDIILQNLNIVKKIEEVNCRKSNNKTYIDVCLIMNDNVTYKEQVDYLALIRKEISEFIPDSVVKLVIGQTDYIEKDK